MSAKLKTDQVQSTRQTRLATKKREPRTVIVSFRLRPSEANLLIRDMAANPCSGVDSIKQLVRKLAVDYAQGRLHFANPTDRMFDLSVNS